MKYLYLLMIVFLLNTIESNAQEFKGIYNHTQSFNGNVYSKYNGTIGADLKITMYLKQVDTVLSGYYFYHSKGELIEFIGSVNQEKDVHLIEDYDDQYKESKFVNGKFDETKNEFAGIFTNVLINKKFPIKLKKDNSIKGYINNSFYQSELCKEENDTTIIDYQCHKSTISIDQLKGYENRIQDKINRNNFKRIQGDQIKYSDPKQMIDSGLVKFWYEDENKEYEVVEVEDRIDVVSIKKNVITFENYSYEFTGGAHGNKGIWYLNYSLKTGELIQLSDIFKANKLSELFKIADSIFIKEYIMGDIESTLIDENKEGRSNYFITNAGITFVFSQASVVAYSAGHIFTFIPFSRIENLFNTSGLINDFIDK